MNEQASLVLRLAGPLQSWGISSQFNSRWSEDRPTKSGLIGLLAAAQGRQRGEPITDLLGLSLGVRVDQPGSFLRDYHTVSNLAGEPLLSAAVSKKGQQKSTSPKKFTHVTVRQYIQDAVFIGAVQGPTNVMVSLAQAVRNPRFPLFLGRRSCVPADPMVVQTETGDDLWPGTLLEVLKTVPWQAGVAARTQAKKKPVVNLAATIEESDSLDTAADVPVDFAPGRRGFTSRFVTHTWVEIPTGVNTDISVTLEEHDPFDLLGW